MQLAAGLTSLKVKLSDTVYFYRLPQGTSKPFIKALASSESVSLRDGTTVLNGFTNSGIKQFSFLYGLTLLSYLYIYLILPCSMKVTSLERAKIAVRMVQ